MSLDYSAVPRMPDGRTAAEHIAAVEATASRGRACADGPSAGAAAR